MHTEDEREERPDAGHLADDVVRKKAANAAVKKKNSQFDLYGVLYFGCTSENTAGTRPSRLME
jgi:hypothetical protein